MKKILLITFSVLSFDVMIAQKTYTPLPTALSTEEIWGSAFQVRRMLIEEKTGIKFDTAWIPRMQFGIPSYITNRLKFGGCYAKATQSFWMPFSYYNEPPDSVFKSPRILMAIDHELGHALADQICRRKNFFAWPPDTVSSTNEDTIAGKILSEGVGEYFGRLFTPDTIADSEWLPGGSSSLCRSMPKWEYYGGYWLVKPIIDQFGEKGIAYISSHTFSYEGNRIRQAGYEYQKKAIETLSKN